MSSPCTGDTTTCGQTYTRKTACYQVPANFQPKQGWTTQSNVTAVDASFCPDVASTPTYDAASGAVVTRGTDGKLVVSTTCGPCNYAAAVLPWTIQCPCDIAAGDYCMPAGNCHLKTDVKCTATQCPNPTTSLSLYGQRFHRYR